jgi:hypothetical protein
LELWNVELKDKAARGESNPSPQPSQGRVRNRYTTCRIGRARNSERGPRNRRQLGSTVRAHTSALHPTVIPGGFEPPLSSVSGRHLEPLGHGTSSNSEVGARSAEPKTSSSSLRAPRSDFRALKAEGVGFEPTRLVRATALAPQPGQPYPAPVRKVAGARRSRAAGRTPVGRTSKFENPRAPANSSRADRVDPPGIEPGLPVCHTGVIPLDHRPNRAQWSRGESNPAVARAKRNPRPRAAPVCVIG